jgi:hypothetical protein
VTRGRRATLPPPSWEMAEAVTGGGLSVTLRLEDDPDYLFDTSGMAGPEAMRSAFATAVLAWTASAAGGRRTSTVRKMRSSLSAFLRWVETANEVEDAGLLAGISDITPFHLRRFRADLEAKHAVHTANYYYIGVCTLLGFAGGVADATERERRKRKSDRPPPTRPVQRYSAEQFSNIRNGARRVVAAAHERITAASALAAQAGDPQCLEPVKAQALAETIRDGIPSTVAGKRALGAQGSLLLDSRGADSARGHLFLSSDEVFAAAVLVACHRGLNLSAVEHARTPVVHEPGVIQVDLDKPRRGPRYRFWPEIIVDDFLDDETADEEPDPHWANALQMIAEATEPARAYLTAQGQPADRLLVYWPAFSSNHRTGIPNHKTRVGTAWLPAGITIEFPRLRRSAETGPAKQPSNHTPVEYLAYLRTDPVALVEEQSKAAAGIQHLENAARLHLAMRAITDREADPGKDALLANCADPEHRPGTGTACTSGFYSFLDCLDCENAATAPRLLPRQMAAVHVLEELRGSIGPAWEQRFARRFSMLQAVIARYSTPADREAAAATAPLHYEVIVAALRHEVPPHER